MISRTPKTKRPGAAATASEPVSLKPLEGMKMDITIGITNRARKQSELTARATAARAAASTAGAEPGSLLDLIAAYWEAEKLCEDQTGLTSDEFDAFIDEHLYPAIDRLTEWEGEVTTMQEAVAALRICEHEMFDASECGQRMFDAAMAYLEHVRSDCPTVHAVDGDALTLLSLSELISVHETVSAAATCLSGMMSQPRLERTNFLLNPGGEQVDFLVEHQDKFLAAVADAIAAKSPETPSGIRERAEFLLKWKVANGEGLNAVAVFAAHECARYQAAAENHARCA